MGLPNVQLFPFFIREWRIIKVFMTYKVHSSLNVAPFCINNWRFYCRRLTALYTVPNFTVYAISIHLHLTALCLEVFRKPGAGMGFMFYSPRSGCWVEQWAVVLQELKQWFDANHVFWSLGCALCVGGSREPQGPELCSQESLQPSFSILLDCRGGFFLVLMDLKEQWFDASASRVGVGFKISWRQRVLLSFQLGVHQRALDEVLNQRTQMHVVRDIFKCLWDKCQSPTGDHKWKIHAVVKQLRKIKQRGFS